MHSRVQIAVLAGLLLLLGVILAPRLLPGKPSESERLVWQNEDYLREGYGKGVRRLLNLHRYSELEAMADTLRYGGYTYESGFPQITTFIEDSFGDVDDKNDAMLWDRHLSRLTEWTDSRPTSTTARIALAQGLVGRAWAARGNGYASSVSRKGWQGFEDDIDAAGNVLRQCPDSARQTPEWWRIYLSVLHCQGGDHDSVYRATYQEAVARFPSYWRFHTHMSNHLMPRWYGEIGEWEAFAMTCARSLPDSLGPEVYARIVVGQSKFVDNVFEASHGLSWAMLSKGIDAWEQRCPESTQPRSARAMLAWQSGRRTIARRAFAAVGDTVELEIWRRPERFLRARHWAQAG